MGVRVRYAPSPTGSLHLGSARTTLFNWLFARQTGGTFVLRLEDTDQARSTAAHAEALCESLRWLGLQWDEGPGVGGPHGPYNQMARLDIYRQALETLRNSGAVYPCYCTPAELAERREEQRARGLPPRYDGRCRQLGPRERERLEAEGRRPAWRLRVPEEGATVVHDLVQGDVTYPNHTLDDLVIVRSDGIPTYNFVVTCDDRAMEITHVLRGDDHLANTPKQLFIYEALGATPPAFGHLPSVLATDRTRLSKRHGPVSIEEYRKMGLVPEGILNYCALLGWSPGDGREVMAVDELVEAFDLGRVGRSGSVYDAEKMRWMNAQHLRRLPVTELAERAEPWLGAASLGAAERAGGPSLEDVLALVRERIHTLADIPPAVGYFYREPDTYDPAGAARHFGPDSPALLRAMAGCVEDLPIFGEPELEAAYRALADQLNLRAAALIHPTRLALTGRTVGPSLFALAALLGRSECAGRLRRAAERVAAQLAG